MTPRFPANRKWISKLILGWMLLEAARKTSIRMWHDERRSDDWQLPHIHTRS